MCDSLYVATAVLKIYLQYNLRHFAILLVTTAVTIFVSRALMMYRYSNI